MGLFFMGIENLSEIARQINPELWDKPESEGSDSIKVVHNFIWIQMENKL